jgi:hypothetical protein
MARVPQYDQPQVEAAPLRAPAQGTVATAARGPVDIANVLARSMMLSSLCWTGITKDREPVCFFGVPPFSLLGDIGRPWMLGTDKAHQFPRVLVVEGRRYVERMLGLYPHLVNYVDARNTRSVRWLARLGFTVHAPHPHGEAGLPFHRFELRA